MIRRAAGNGNVDIAARPRDERTALAARFQSLWQCVRDACEAAPLTIGVTACQRGHGTTTVAANLAICAARASWGRVVLVEANFTMPILARTFGVAAGPGLADVFADGVSLGECIQDTPIENLLLLTAGRARPRYSKSPGSLTNAARTDILAQLGRDFAVVVCDLPAASDASDAQHWAAQFDGTLLVIESGQARADLVQPVKQRLVRSGARLLGAVLNKCPPESAPLAPPRLTP